MGKISHFIFIDVWEALEPPVSLQGDSRVAHTFLIFIPLSLIFQRRLALLTAWLVFFLTLGTLPLTFR
jgi:hypothetical protein